MRFKATLREPRINISRYREAVHNKLKREIDDAAKAWLDTMVGSVAEGIIPVWSGASAATFLPLARKVSYGLSIMPVTNDGVGIAAGAAEGGAMVTKSKDKLKYIFQYSTRLDHLIFNEFNNANQILGLKLRRPGPYGFQIRGAEMFEVLSANVSLPNPYNYIRVKSSSV